MLSTKGSSKDKMRKTLIDRVKETTVRDPAAHARLQVTELDKTAQRSAARRKACNDQIDSDNKEISKIDDQLALLRLRYDPLCQHLTEAKEQRAHLQATLESCMQEEMKVSHSFIHFHFCYLKGTFQNRSWELLRILHMRE